MMTDAAIERCEVSCVLRWTRHNKSSRPFLHLLTSSMSYSCSFHKTLDSRKQKRIFWNLCWRGTIPGADESRDIRWFGGWRENAVTPQHNNFVLTYARKLAYILVIYCIDIWILIPHTLSYISDACNQVSGHSVSDDFNQKRNWFYQANI